MARSKRRRDYEEEEEEEELPPSDEDEAAELEEEQQQQEDAQQDEAGPSSSKRQRSEYPRGTVKKVKVYNFMTYGTPAVEITPGPRLNLVLGPNGTGKSSLVCALCLGLTGGPKLLGRADNIKDFIRRGADSGWVETTLSGGPGRRDSVVKCEMLKTAEGYTTRWKINNTTKSKRDVVELVKSMNIQFDNLCQFLPQDKVVEFARMDPYELLIATEKAIGDSSLHDTHLALIEKRNGMKTKEQRRNAEQEAHDSLVTQNQGLEREYQRFEKKQKLMKSIQVIKKKLAWMDVKDAQERARTAGEEEIDKKKQLEEARKAAKGDERPAKQREQQAMAARAQASAVIQEVKKQELRLKKALDKAAQEDTAVKQLRDQINGLQAESDKRKHEIDIMRKKMGMVQANLEKFGPLPDHSAEIQQLTNQQTELREQLTSLVADRESTMGDLQHATLQRGQVEGQLRELGTASYRRLHSIIEVQSHFMKRDMRALHNFTQWVQQQQRAGLFVGQVVGPLGVEIKLKSRVNGRQMDGKWISNLEQAVWSQLANFAVQDRQDERVLSNQLAQMGLQSIKVVAVTGNIDAPIGSETANLGSFGVVANLNELFDAPPLVRHALNNICNLDGSYIMEGHDLDLAKSMMEGNQRVRRVYSPEQCMTYVRSLYGTKDDAHMKAESLMPSKILGATAAGADVDERKQMLESQLANINKRIAELEQAQLVAESSMEPLQKQDDALQKQKQELQEDYKKKLQGKRRLQDTLKQAEKLLAQRERAPEPLLQAPQLEKKIKAALKAHHAAVTEALASTDEGWQQLQQHTVAELTMRELDMQAKAMRSHMEEQRRAVTLLEGEHRTALARAKALMDAYKRAKDQAEEEHPLDAAAKKAFTELSDDREELSSDLSELEEKVDNIAVNNPRVAQEYRHRKEQIEVKAKALADLQAQLDAATQQLELLKTRWLPELQRVVGVINSSFSTNFSDIGCAGEVHLDQHEDYDKFSIQIKVKFREDEQLQLLTAHRQSGGERSVSTILYLIALQGVTVTPFRVVDEINQGMDPANERKVFEQLVVASCKEGTPQCFLLTPKLLPDLPFTEDITVLNIFNGALISDQVATNYTMGKLFGSKNMDLLRQLRTVPVAG